MQGGLSQLISFSKLGSRDSLLSKYESSSTIQFDSLIQ
jgi:hypothetical protein